MSKGRDRKPGLSRRTFLQHAVAGAGATAAAAVGATAIAAEADVRGAGGSGFPPEFAAGARRDAPGARLSDDRRAGLRARLQGRRRRRALLLSRQLHRHPRDRRDRHSRPTAAATRARWRTRPTPSSAVTGEIAVCSGTEGPGFTDMICAIACANAARTPLLVAREQHVDVPGRHRSRHSARLPAADDRRAEEVREAADQPAGGCTSTPATRSAS